MKELYRVHPRDAVAVALRPLAAGQTVDGPDGPLTLREPIPAGHKVALREIAGGETAIKYGFLSAGASTAGNRERPEHDGKKHGPAPRKGELTVLFLSDAAARPGVGDGLTRRPAAPPPRPRRNLPRPPGGRQSRAGTAFPSRHSGG